jgi:hypothetical protein
MRASDMKILPALEVKCLRDPGYVYVPGQGGCGPCPFLEVQNVDACSAMLREAREQEKNQAWIRAVQGSPSLHPATGNLVPGVTHPLTPVSRKATPLATGCLDYFPAALSAVAQLSRAGNDKHNPGEPMHWARGKSMDHADCILRHMAERGTIDLEDGISHTVKVAWRALALLQEELEAAGAPRARGAK